MTFAYGCGGHITKGNGVCQMNPITQAELERLNVDAALDHYRPYLATGGRRRMGEAVKQQMDSEGEDFQAARARAEEDRERTSEVINNLLDNLTPANREYVDQRLEELTKRREQLESRLDELEPQMSQIRLWRGRGWTRMGMGMLDLGCA